MCSAAADKSSVLPFLRKWGIHDPDQLTLEYSCAHSSSTNFQELRSPKECELAAALFIQSTKYSESMRSKPQDTRQWANTSGYSFSKLPDAIIIHQLDFCRLPFCPHCHSLHLPLPMLTSSLGPAGIPSSDINQAANCSPQSQVWTLRTPWPHQHRNLPPLSLWLIPAPDSSPLEFLPNKAIL